MPSTSTGAVTLTETTGATETTGEATTTTGPGTTTGEEYAGCGLVRTRFDCVDCCLDAIPEDEGYVEAIAGCLCSDELDPCYAICFGDLCELGWIGNACHNCLAPRLEDGCYARIPAECRDLPGQPSAADELEDHQPGHRDELHHERHIDGVGGPLLWWRGVAHGSLPLTCASGSSIYFYPACASANPPLRGGSFN